MKGDLHYEVVLDPTGRAHHVYFTRRGARGAAGVDRVGRRPDDPPVLPKSASRMQIDETGESWVGAGRPVEAPASATARLAFAIEHEPYFIDIPFASAPLR